MNESRTIRALTEAVVGVRRKRLELFFTLYAIQHRRRTPQQVRAVLSRARAVLYKNQVVTRRLQRGRRVH